MLLCCTWKDERMGEEEAGGQLPECAGCRQHIYDEQYLQALDTDWHTLCFRAKPMLIDSFLLLAKESVKSSNQMQKLNFPIVLNRTDLQTSSSSVDFVDIRVGDFFDINDEDLLTTHSCDGQLSADTQHNSTIRNDA
ncbi:hypothetical protein QQF64_008046 [Cirrhinus molitorella]|uniref:LIM zinc-binding domain-containing protein n=1 Tax=Cirrhinus molitorella TaxID=172907 RepID=A0ABR3M8F5_9TELE